MVNSYKWNHSNRILIYKRIEIVNLEFAHQNMMELLHNLYHSNTFNQDIYNYMCRHPIFFPLCTSEFVNMILRSIEDHLYTHKKMFEDRMLYHLYKNTWLSSPI